MRILILGGNSRLAVALANLLTGTHEVVLVFRQQAQGGMEIEVSRYDQLPDAALEGVDCIVNCVGTSFGDKAQLDYVNSIIPKAVGNRALALGIKHFVQISSFSIFGHAPEIGKDTALAPVTAYGRSKLVAERSLEELATKGLDTAFLRVPIIYGLGAWTKLNQLAQMMSRLHFFAGAKSKPRRSVIHAANCAVAIREIIERRRKGPIFAADIEDFEISMLAEALRRANKAIYLARIPDAILAPLAATAPGMHFSLFSPNLLNRNENFGAGISMPISLSEGLDEIVSRLPN